MNYKVESQSVFLDFTAQEGQLVERVLDSACRQDEAFLRGNSIEDVANLKTKFISGANDDVGAVLTFVEFSQLGLAWNSGMLGDKQLNSNSFVREFDKVIDEITDTIITVQTQTPPSHYERPEPDA